MKTYVARRLLALIPVGLVVATVAFLLMHLAPGNPASIIAGADATADDVRTIERQLGLDRPLPIQLVQWYGRLLRGDLGSSIFLRKPVTEAILDRVEPTLLLTVFSTVIAVLIGVSAGVLSARYHNSITDQVFMIHPAGAVARPLSRLTLDPGRDTLLPTYRERAEVFAFGHGGRFARAPKSDAGCWYLVKEGIT